MPDWSAIVRERLTTTSGDVARDEEIRAELAGHLEDAYSDALRRHLAIFVPTLVAAALTDGRMHPEHLRFDFQLGAAFVFLVIPGAALMLGAAPFLRDRAVEERR